MKRLIETGRRYVFEIFAAICIIMVLSVLGVFCGTVSAHADEGEALTITEDRDTATISDTVESTDIMQSQDIDQSPDIAVVVADKIIRNSHYTFKITGKSTVEITDFSLEGYASEESKDSEKSEDTEKSKQVVIDLPAKVTCMTKKGKLKEYKVDGIGETAFAGCRGVKAFNIPEGYRYLRAGAFAVCDIESAELPDSVVSVYESAFYGCTALKKVILSANLKKLGAGVFSYCDSLKEIKLPKENKYFKLSDGIIYTHNKKKVVSAALPATEVSIPEGVTSIAAYAFEGQTKLESVSFPSTLKKIGEGAFYDCSSLERLYIPKSVKNIAKAAFSGCRSLKKVEFASGKTKLDNNTVYDEKSQISRTDQIFCNAGYYLEICIPYKYMEKMTAIIKQHCPKGVIITTL